MISLQRFSELADAYGGDLARWPAELRDEARAVIAAAPVETDQILARERALDHALDAMETPPRVSDLLARRLIKAAPKRVGPPVWAAMAASVVLGLAVGFGGVRAWDDAANLDTAMSQAWGGEDAWASMGQDG